MLPKDRLFIAPLLLLWTALTGCTVTATTGSSSTCAADDSVIGCGGAQGYSCTGADSPDESNSALNCSSGTLSSDATLYCCIDDSQVTGGCTIDSSIVGCVNGSFGFSCTTGDRPETGDSSLVCSSGTATASGTDYCCVTGVVPSTGCSEDTTVSCGTAIGFSCTGTTGPDASDSALSCGAGVPGSASGTTAYCCSTTSTMAGSCVAGAEVACAAPTIGYSCAGGLTPTAADGTALSCGAGVDDGNGSLGYCCNPPGSTTTDTCAPDSTVTGCGTGGSGYSCTGAATPGSVAAVLCEPPTAGATAADYCCYPVSGTTCVADTTVTGCTAGSSGFTCTGTDSPETDTSSALLCGPGTAGSNAGTPFCCASN
jgi:hypothetical protein